MTKTVEFARQALLAWVLVGCADLRASADPTAGSLSGVNDGIAAFRTIHRVLTHPRCLNCHPTDDVPRQGDDQQRHALGVVRGPDNHGALGMRCITCHSIINQINGVPGVDGWSLAPKEMGWTGLDEREICQQLKDPNRNGGRTLQDTLAHLTEHPLVLWAWTPGVHPGGRPRTPPSVPLEEFRAAAHTWIERGGPCPPGLRASRQER